ncbi:hypothetical protein O5D80_006904 [Batrachochytrium dendrobatidis]|nr:hypothetical protein O5D80_006904 [Batrachochytrium dendrobatidis]
MRSFLLTAACVILACANTIMAQIDTVPDSQMWDNPKFESKHKSNYQFRIRRRIPVDDPHRDE